MDYFALGCELTNASGDYPRLTEFDRMLRSLDTLEAKATALNRALTHIMETPYNADR